MGREIKRVPVDFDWPLEKVWDGYLSPDSLNGTPCPDCKSGYAPRAQYLHDLWYGYEPFKPQDTGSTVLTPDTPAVRAFAERNVSNAPDYYGTGELAIRREGQRLCNIWNGMWSHHLTQEDVDALVEAGRLMDLTHTWDRERRWQKIEPPVTPTAEQVNEWSLRGFGHDSINAWIAVEARCKREGAEYNCATCDGHASLESYPGQRADADAWERTEPPSGDGWQVWETVSEGSPITPVMPTAEALVAHLATVGTTWDVKRGDGPWRRSAAESFVKSEWAPTFIGSDAGLLVGGRDSDKF